MQVSGLTTQCLTLLLCLEEPLLPARGAVLLSASGPEYPNLRHTNPPAVICRAIRQEMLVACRT